MLDQGTPQFASAGTKEQSKIGVDSRKRFVSLFSFVSVGIPPPLSYAATGLAHRSYTVQS
jgi:hypothetical protein